MKDNEKQIEEMAKDIANIHRNFLEDENFEILDDYIAEKLINQGYQKLPKNNVVLTREEYEYLKNNQMPSSPVVLTEKQYVDIKLEAVQASRETAEKILFKFESAFAYYDNEDMFSKKAIFECLEEIVKSLGVEIGDK